MNQDLAELLDAHGAMLHALLWRLTLRHDVAEDLLQELFVKLIGSNHFRTADRPVAYLKRSAINLALDWRRGRKRQAASFEDMIEVESQNPSPMDTAADAEQLIRILDAAACLPELSRQAFVLRFVQEESFEGIATVLGKTSHQARGLCHHAIRQLRAQLNPTVPAGSLPEEVSHG